MELPFPPTDNLYKFMAIAGLVLMIACSYGTIWLSLSLQSRASGLMIEADTLKVEIKYYEEDLKRDFGDSWGMFLF